MNVEARNLFIENVLKKGQFIIPEYQREYDWTDENLDEFLEDLLQSEEENYFIGHMVCEGDFNGSKFKVIDGQQRITTITIMLSVLRDIFYEKELSNFADGIHENYIFSKDKDYNEYVILDNKMPYPILQTYVQSKVKNKNIKPEKLGEKKIIEAYDKFYALWKDLSEQELKDIRDKVLKLEVIFVAVDNEVDAFTIFETLNAKGKDLTPLDLIKNKVFKNYQKEPQLNEPSDSWKEIIENTKDKNMKFLNYYWASRYKKVSDKKLYRDFVEESKNEEFNYNEFVEDLLMNSKIYNKIIDPDINDWKNTGEFKAFLSLKALQQTFNIQVANSLLISLIREYNENNISLKYLTLSLSSIEKFHFINNAIIGGRSSGLDTMYSKISRDIYAAASKHEKHNILDDMIVRLKEKLPSLEQFESKVDTRLYYLSTNTKQKKLVQYVLLKLEYERQNYNVEMKDISIEHIQPENSLGNSLDIKHIQSIGNLVLLDRDINSQVGNKIFYDKKSIILKESTLLTTKEVFENNNKWEVEEINNRKKSIVRELYEL